MEGLGGILYGFSVALTPFNLLMALIGAVLGTLVGVLPGLGPTGAMAMLLPFSFLLDPTAALIMLAGIYYGAMYGGSTTSILVNVPGEAASVATCIEGYKMAKKGRAGAALAVAAVGSFVAGTLGIVILMLAAPLLAGAALSFGPPEFLTLAIVGMVVLVPLLGGSVLNNSFTALLGVALGTVGMEQMTGVSRFTFGSVPLSQGFEVVSVAMGLFGVAEVLVAAETVSSAPEVIKTKLRELFPSRSEWTQATPAMFRGSAVGLALGLLPGPSSTLSAFTSYAIEKRVAGAGSSFGEGAIQGVAGPEAANNAACSTAFVPLLALGIPFAPATAILLAALMMHGVQPGPLLMSQRPDVFWGVIASMYLGNAMLLVLNLPLVGLWASILRLPAHVLTALIGLFALVGSYSVNNSVLDLIVLVGMGVAGYVFRKMGYDAAPLVLGFVLGPMMETAFRQSIIMTQGDLTQLLLRPLVLAIAALGSLPILSPWIYRQVRGAGRSARKHGDGDS